MKTIERGMKKWVAFQSITAQYDGIKKILHNQKKVPRPVIDEDKIENINRILVEAYNLKLEIAITYYSDGFYKKCNGRMKNISTVYRCVEFTNSHVIQYTDIVDVEIV